MFPLGCIITAIRTTKMDGIQFENLENLSNLVGTGANHWNDSGDEYVSNSGASSCYREAARHLEAQQ